METKVIGNAFFVALPVAVPRPQPIKRFAHQGSGGKVAALGIARKRRDVALIALRIGVFEVWRPHHDHRRQGAERGFDRG